MIKKGILKISFFLFFQSVWGSIQLDIPEEGIHKALSHTVFILGHSGICHGVIVSPFKVLTAAHCMDDIKADNLEDLKVFIYTGHNDSTYPTDKNFFEQISKMRSQIANCLIKERIFSNLGTLKEFILSDCSWTISINEKPNLQGVVNIHQVSKIYMHPGFRLENVKSEDSAIIILKNPVSFHVNVMIYDESPYSRWGAVLVEQTIEMVSGFFNSLSDTPKREETFPSICFFTSWLNSHSVYQHVQTVSLESFYQMITQNSEFQQAWKKNVEDSPPLIGFLKSQLYGDAIMEAYIDLFKNEQFIPYITSFIKKGYSGSPLWCYKPDIGIFLRGYLGHSTYDNGILFIRNFDKNLYQWIEEQE